MKKTAVATIALTCAVALPAQAADLSLPPVVDVPYVDAPEPQKMADTASGWYLRGDVGYNYHKLKGAHYMTSTGPADFTTAKLKSGFSIGAGIGYRVNSHLRTDLTADYTFKTSFNGSTGPGGPCTVNSVVYSAPNCTSKDTASFTALSLLANAYVDVFAYGRVKGYVGAGLGGTYIDWSTLHNTECGTSGGTTTCSNTSIDHLGAHGWRFTAALMAGASVEINCALDADLGYRYRYISGGSMFGYNATGGTGAGQHKAIHAHDARVGLRYKLGGCHDPIPPYEPPYEPPVYK